MGDMEFNKIFAAILVAGIIASLSGFISKKVYHPHELEKNAVTIDVPEVSASGVIAAPQTAEPILNLLATADIARGEKLSRACAACHSFDKGGANGVGPNLWDKLGKKAGSKAGYSYSTAFEAADVTWDYETLNQFLWKPKKYIPGTKMNYIGLKKPEDRAAMVGWMRTLSDSPKALPELQSE